jgi:5-methylcytosine-specific restriction endonuclease McrA
MGYGNAYGSLINTITGSRRLEALQAAEFKCQRCGWEGTPNEEGRFSGLEVHHLDGQHLYPEDHREENLLVLCGPCHDKEHGRKSPEVRKVGGRPRFRQVAREEAERLGIPVSENGEGAE